MAKSNIEVIRQILKAMAVRLSGEVAGLRGEALGTNGLGDADAIPSEQADLAIHMTEEDRTLSLLGNEQKMLAEVRAALDRIEHGKFGRCEECKKSISPKRLEAVPYARHCVFCARWREKMGESELAAARTV